MGIEDFLVFILWEVKKEDIKGINYCELFFFSQLFSSFYNLFFDSLGSADSAKRVAAVLRI